MLNSIMRGIDKHVFLRNEVTKSDVLALANRDKPSDYLPYMSFIKQFPDDDAPTNAFLNFDNTIGWIWELKPLAFLGPDKLDQLHGIVRAQFPQGTVSQWILYPDTNLDEHIEQYKAARDTSDPVTAMNTASMENFLREGIEGVEKIANIPVRNFRLFYTIKNEQRIPEELIVSIDQAFDMAGMEPRRMDASALLKWSSEFFTGKPNKGIYDPSRPLRKQMNATGLDFSLPGSASYLGHRYGICLYPNVVPQTNNNPLITNQLLAGLWDYRMT